uniref:Uncharacterized protein n=1 Tax=Wenzhou levi-like virus 2 TaxID=1923568 RepID=A0A1L3KIZ8_9VIRU|nr:hypothetical protein [Wenzhou levi-like virus 2]
MVRLLPKKSRSSSAGGGILGTSYDGTGTPSIKRGRTYVSSEWIQSGNHAGPPYRSGGPMLLQRTRYTYKDSGAYFGSLSSNSLVNAYKGSFQVGYVPIPISLPSYNLDALGTEGVSQSIPTSPSASLSVFIAEMRDIPRMLIQTRKFFGRMAQLGIQFSRVRKNIGDAVDDILHPGHLGGDYLNLQFGWMPFLRDLLSFYQVGQNLDERVKFLRTHNMGKPVTRTRTLRKWGYTTLAENYVANTVTAMMLPSLPHSFMYSSVLPCATRNRTIEHKGRIWFKGTYLYYSPEVANMPDWYLKADIMGLRLDPAVIYQLVPWTWLLDWFTTAGPLVRNAVEFARHHVVMHHGYCMATMSTNHRSIETQNVYSGYSASVNKKTQTVTGEATCLFEQKQRVVANPYGFGVKWEGLSPYQLSILGALGINRRSTDQ